MKVTKIGPISAASVSALSDGALDFGEAKEDVAEVVVEVEAVVAPDAASGAGAFSLVDSASASLVRGALCSRELSLRALLSQATVIHRTASATPRAKVDTRRRVVGEKSNARMRLSVVDGIS